MGKLRDIDFKTLYSDPEDVADFYSKALIHAKLYRRISAYFTTGIFKYLSKGIPEFINNDGYMQLIITKEIDENTIDMINEGYSQKDSKLFSVSDKEINDTVSKLCCQNDINIFSYLIAIGKLDVRIVYKLKGIVHDKFGIISDNENSLAYLGSNNFTEQSVALNDESFQVTIDWDDPSKRELKLINDLNALFDLFWNNEKNNVITVELPDDYITSLIKNIDWKEIENTKKDYDYIRFDIDNERKIILTSNIDISNYLTKKIIGSYADPFLLRKEKDKYIFENIEYVSEMWKLKNIIIDAIKKDKITLYLTKRASDFFDIKYRDYDLLCKKGLEIKKDNYLTSSQFNFYRDKINSSVKRPLKDKQILAAIHMIEMDRSLNFSVPGSGKTATVLGAFEYLNSLQNTNKNYVDKILVVGPKNCAKSWCDEYKEVSYSSSSHLPLCLINDDNINDKIGVLEHDYKNSRLIILNYEIVSKLKDSLCDLVDKHTFVVFDEIHRIKKVDSKKYMALKEIIDKTRYRVALTGTPLPNGYIDLFNMISLLHDDFTQSYFSMFESYLKADDSQYRKTGLQNKELNERLNPFFIRINKKDLNVPLAEPDHLIYIQTNNKERELYNSIKFAKYSSFDETIKLVEIGCVPFKCENNTEIEEFSDELNGNINLDKFNTSKLSKFISIVKKNNRKCVVWCTYVDTIKLVTLLLKKEGFKVNSIYGRTNQDDRDKIIDDFNYGTLQIIVTNPATLAESVSLHKSCHDAHYLELNYNLFQYLQSRDRIHRLGLKETDKTNYYIYLNFYDDDMKVSKDLQIYNALAKKELLMKQSIDNGNFVFGDSKDYE